MYNGEVLNHCAPFGDEKIYANFMPKNSDQR